MDTLDLVNNTKKLYMSQSSLEILMDFERVLDQLDLYAYENWSNGELVDGPTSSKHWVEATFMWPHKLMPDPDGAKRLIGYDAIVTFEKDVLKTPVKIEDRDDMEYGTPLNKIREDSIWLVTIKMPKELIRDVEEGFIEIEGEDVDLQDIDDAYENDLDDVAEKKGSDEFDEFSDDDIDSDEEESL